MSPAPLRREPLNSETADLSPAEVSGFSSFADHGFSFVKTATRWSFRTSSVHESTFTLRFG